MDMLKPKPDWPADDDTPCPSKFPWVAHRTADMSDDVSNVRCPAADILIATNLPNEQAMTIVDAHNGLFTEHETDGSSLIHKA